MIPDKYFTPTRLLLLVTFFVFSFSKIDAQDGKAIFIAKCASCHTMGNDGEQDLTYKVLLEDGMEMYNLLNNGSLTGASLQKQMLMPPK